MASNSLIEPTVGEDAKGSSQMLFPVEPFVLEILKLWIGPWLQLPAIFSVAAALNLRRPVPLAGQSR